MAALYTLDRLRSEYVSLFDKMEISNSKRAAAKAQALRIIKNKDTYKRIEAKTGIPWFVVGCIHHRESPIDKETGGPSFNTYLGNGEPLNRVTKLVPKGRGPWKDFETGAYDALVTVENLDDIPFDGPDGCAYAFEKINGFGYRNPARNIPSPYLWGGTNIQKRGKWKESLEGGVYRKWYDPNEMDQQIGAMATLRMLMDLDSDVVFAGAAVPAPVPVPTPAPAEPPMVPQSPRADDTETDVKPLGKSKTIWSSIGQWFATNLASFFGFIDKHPEYVIGFLVFSSALLFLVITGRINVQKIMKHLSQDDTVKA